MNIFMIGIKTYSITPTPTQHKFIKAYLAKKTGGNFALFTLQGRVVAPTIPNA